MTRHAVNASPPGNPNIPQESLSISEEDFNMVNILGDKALNLFTANMHEGGGPVPPPPDEHIPQDILDANNAQKAVAATTAIPALAPHVPSLFANKQQRNSYHPVSNVSGSVQEQATSQQTAMIVNAIACFSE
eukprot:897576_1